MRGPGDDEDVLRAAEAVRKASIRLTHTYSISLTILFLDRLGDPDDVPLIESLMVRLMAGQNPRFGGWSYECPSISAAEVRRLEGKLSDRDARNLDRKERARLRGQALTWLWTELNDWIEQGRTDSPEVRAALRLLLRDGGLNPVREAAALGQLPENEREAWQRFWRDVEALLHKDRSPATR